MLIKFCSTVSVCVLASYPGPGGTKLCVCVYVCMSVLCVCIVRCKNAYACYVRLVQTSCWQVYQTVKFSAKKLYLFPYMYVNVLWEAIESCVLCMCEIERHFKGYLDQ